MKTYRTSFLNVAAFLMLLCSTCILSRSATACLEGIGGPTSFTAAPGSSQTLTWTAYGSTGSNVIMVRLTDESGVFTLSQMPVIISTGDTASFTITFTPGAHAAGTFSATVTCSCGKTYDLEGTIAESGVANSLPSDVSFTISPNPATDYVNILSSGVRTAEIGIYDVLGKEIASSKTTNWKWDASDVVTGSYLVRIVGKSNIGEQFAILRRIIISR